MRATPLSVFALALTWVVGAGCAERLDTNASLADDVGTDPAADSPLDVAPDGLADAGVDGTPCGHNAECLSSYCADLTGRPGGSVCASACDDGCAAGFVCLENIDDGVCVPEDLCVDTDNDSFGFGSGCLGPDCDDLNASSYPGAAERCDGLDNNCDGAIDNEPIGEGERCDTGLGGGCSDGVLACVDGAETCGTVTLPGEEVCNGIDDNCDGFIDNDPVDGAERFVDADGDGHGDPDRLVRVCDDVAGTTRVDDDCDDADPASYPGAPELCDGQDNDCDGDVDNDIVDQIFYVDSDDDGYGDDLGETIVDCVPPDGFAPVGGDCDDSDPAVRPGAAERPGDAVDQNCDEAELCLRDEDDDGYAAASGDTIASADLSCADPGEASADAPTGDCNDTSAQTFPSATEWCDRIDNDCDGDVDDDCVCDDDELACEGSCVPGGTCCTDDDCSGGQTCPSPGLACACPSGSRTCGGSCIADAACCDDSDCEGGATCSAPGGSCSCTPHARQACADGDIYWFDSCDQREELVTECAAGEVCSGAACGCIAHANEACSSGDVYWFDSCGNREEVSERCRVGETCESAQCVCTPNDSRGCYNNNVYWFDSCGNRSLRIEDCTGGQVCSAGTCVCVANDARACDGGDVYWFDSCGNRGDVSDDCTGGEVCTGGACVCEANASQGCDSGDVYWFDSCGSRGAIADSCTDGETCVDGACACAAHASQACRLGDVYWFDSCGNREELAERCDGDCADGACVACVPEDHRGCSGDNAHWIDSCGIVGEMIMNCAVAGMVCDDGRCSCPPDGCP